MDAEVSKLWEAAVEDGDPEHLPREALLDMDSSGGRAEFFNAKVREESGENETPETVQPLTDDSTGDERAAYFEARMAGAEIAEESE